MPSIRLMLLCMRTIVCVGVPFSRIFMPNILWDVGFSGGICNDANEGVARHLCEGGPWGNLAEWRGKKNKTFLPTPPTGITVWLCGVGPRSRSSEGQI